MPHDAASQPSFDERTTALSNGSRRIFETLGAWAAVGAVATPIAKIHVSDQGHFGFARIDAAEQGLAAMGYVVANRALGSGALVAARSEAGPVSVFCPADSGRGDRGQHRGAGAALQAGAGGPPDRGAAGGGGRRHRIPRCARAFGVEAEVRDYEQTAVITTVLPQRFHDNVAYERFTASGPLALLPLADGRCTLVLTLTQDAARSAMALDG